MLEPAPSASRIKPLKYAPKRILVLRYRFIGDTLLSVPFLRNLRRAYPEAHIAMLVAPGSGELLEHCPYLDKLWYLDSKTKQANASDTARHVTFWQAVKHLRQEKYDTAFVLKRSFSSAALAWLTGARQRVGFATEGRAFLLTHPFPYPEQGHEIDAFLSLLNKTGQLATDTYLEAWPGEAAEQKAGALWQAKVFPDDAIHIAVNASASNPGKVWPMERYSALLKRLVVELETQQKETSLYFHAFGAPSDAALYQQLASTLPAPSQETFHNWCGQLSLQETQALLKGRFSLMVGNDSGALHLAASVGVPVVAIFGPMAAERWRPAGESARVVQLGLPCQPCHLKAPCPIAFQCLTQLDEEQVLTACLPLIHQPPLMKKA